MPHDPARKRLVDVFLDPKTIAALLAAAVSAALNVFKLTEKLPDRIRQEATPGELTAIAAFLLWVAFTILLTLLSRWRDRRRHPDGEPTPGRVVIYVAELRGDDKLGSHRNHILLTLRQELGDAIQILRAGIELHAEESGNPEDDARSANRKGQRYLNQTKHKGDLLVWGQIIQESKLVELRFTSSVHDAAEQKRFTFAEKMALAPDFGPEMAAALAAIAGQLVLSAKNPSVYVADALIPIAEKLRKFVANLPAWMGPDERGLLERSYAVAELAIGDQRGDLGALERAAAAYRDALNEFTQERVPLEWARTQSNLGVALFIIGERGSGTERLKAATVAYREALKEWTRERVPLLWATTQNNLGTALVCLGERERSREHLEAAVVAHREALKERPRDRVPVDWAVTQVNLGVALFTIGKSEGGTDRLEASLAATREALKVLTREDTPILWAGAQINLGTTLSVMVERGGDTKQSEAAVAAFREALKECSPNSVSLQWAMAQNNLGTTLEKMGKLEEAAESYRSALQVLTPENHFQLFTGATSNLASVLHKLRARKDGP
ncbi:MAG: tetratricopeptide repeat-containing protein [Terracidiphilus sp.]